ncbi:MAG: TauD/TfdA family dioxygenase [Pseudomonadota bacterium]
MNAVLKIPVLESAEIGHAAHSLSVSGFRDLYYEHGALLLRGVAGSEKDYLAISNRFGVDWFPYRLGNRPAALAGGLHIQRANAGKHAMAAHSELCHMPVQPDMAWFYCDRAPLNGGQTTLYDGAAIASALTQDLLEFFSGKRLLYLREMSVDEALRAYNAASRDALQQMISDRGWEQYLQIQGDKLRQEMVVPALPVLEDSKLTVFVNQIVFNAKYRPWLVAMARRVSGPLHKRSLAISLLDRIPVVSQPGSGLGVPAYPTLEDGTMIPLWVIRALGKIIKQMEMKQSWQKGDILVFDNRRFMHGRTAVQDTQRLILTRFGSPIWDSSVGSDTGEAGP